MDFDEFTGTIEHRLALPDTGRTVRSIRATLMPLGERIQEGDAEDLASALPMEIDWYLHGAPREHGRRFDYRAFVERIADVTGEEPQDAAYRAQVVMDLVCELAPEADVRQLRDGLPESERDGDWGELFGIVDDGGWSEGREAAVGGGR